MAPRCRRCIRCKKQHALAGLRRRTAPLMTRVLVRLVLVPDPMCSVSRVFRAEAAVNPIFDGSWPRDDGVHMVQYSACARRVAPSNCTFDIPCSCTALFAADSLPLSSLLAGEALSRVGRSVGNLTLRPPCRPRGCLRSPQRPGCAPRVEGEESHGIPVLLK